jgi:hypothetical protein
MIRVMTATKPHTTTVTVDGEVADEYVEAIDTCVKQAIGKGRPVHLFLRDVSKIDETGQALLNRLAANGVHLSANGVYISYIVAEINRSAAHAKRRFGFRPGVAEVPVRRQAPSGRQTRSTESTISGGGRDALEHSGERTRKCG